MRSCSSVVENYTFEIPAVNTLIIEENIVAMHRQGLINKQCPPKIRTTVTDENGLFDARGRDLALVVTDNRRVDLPLCVAPLWGVQGRRERVWGRIPFCGDEKLGCMVEGEVFCWQLMKTVFSLCSAMGGLLGMIMPPSCHSLAHRTQLPCKCRTSSPNTAIRISSMESEGA